MFDLVNIFLSVNRYVFTTTTVFEQNILIIEINLQVKSCHIF